MQQRLIPLLAMALALSAGASFVFYRLIAGKLNASKATAENRLVVAVRDLPTGTLMASGDVRLSDWTGAVPPRSIARLQDAVGRGVTSPIYRGEPVLEQRLAPRGAGAGLAPTIPPGKRAVSIRVNEVAGVSGFAVPGTRVDVVVQGRPERNGARGEAFARTLLQNVEVLSAGQKHQRDIEGKPILVQSVNLLVTPEEAELLSLANNEARLQLVLRNPVDVGRAETKGWFTPDLFPMTIAGRVPAPPRRRMPLDGKLRPAPAAGSSAVAPRSPAITTAPPAIAVELWHGSRKTQETFLLEGES